MFITESWGSLSTAQKNLILHGENSEHLHNVSKYPTLSRLSQTARKGKYDKETARDAWLFHADRVAKNYHESGGDTKVPWDKAIPASDRKSAAKYWEEMHRHHVKEMKFNEDGTLIKETLVNPLEIKMSEMLEGIMDKKPTVVRDSFNSIMETLIDGVVANLKDEVAAKVLKKEFLQNNSKELPNG